MPTNFLSTITYAFALTTDKLAQTRTSLQGLLTDFASGLLDLNTQQQMQLRKVNAKSTDWVGRAYGYAIANPHMISPLLDMEQYGNDLAGYDALRDIEQMLERLLDVTKNTRTFLGARNFNSGRLCYKGFQTAAEMGEPGAELIVDDLSTQFAGQGRTAKPDDGDDSGGTPEKK